MAKTVIEILNGISQALARKHHGYTDEKGEKLDIGLLRDEGEDIKDQRVMDGFNVKIVGKTLVLKYHCEERLDTVYKRDIEADTEAILADVISFLKKEYRLYTKEALNLRKPSKVTILAQPISRRTVVITASQTFEIGNLDECEDMRQPSEDKLNDTVKKFLAVGEKKYPGTKKPLNDLRKKADEEDGIIRWTGNKK